uniref:Signal peptidase I n=1 Tax=Candidatus Kentrum sp. DK TaxID=2126562 RepID=A0A450TIP1_9GAMM|nr:MAG: signal peptidase I Serine peptidase. MEROPS family S26A [Candidatus Kentron sp. DK]VFJ67201.1 MAG: signal peptidase I Serine peptidase. MEROPS family S26A [Candidatus Kentron sp. DK]
MNLDFSTILLLLVLLSGAIWAFDATVLAPRRQHRRLVGGDIRLSLIEKIADYARSFFPVFLAVLLLRSFLVEPFRIPSGSMLPTLEIGDFILVNKYTYGIRLPVLDRKIIDIGKPERGDVIVFRYPEDGVTPYIKRVVGLPGDRIDYRNDTLYINGKRIAREFTDTYRGTGANQKMDGAERYLEHLGNVDHNILIRPGQVDILGIRIYPHVPIRIPEGQYFVMGDNRNNSKDSRFWGTVPDENLIGKAFLIWMNLDLEDGVDWSRVGNSIE